MILSEEVAMLFSKKIEPNCLYCRHGSKISDEEVICIKKGVHSSGAHCRQFKYDPLKRQPSRPINLKTSNLSEEDFKL